MKNPELTVDNTVDAGYLSLRDVPVASTHALSKNLIIDVDSDGNVVGIELFGISGLKAMTVNDGGAR